jgi:hypothetical protein
MDVNRRNLMKGVLTGGTLLALGIPPGVFAGTPAGRAGRFGLLLGNSRADAAFAAGAHAAYAGAVGGFDGAPEVVKLEGGLLNDYEKVAELLDKSYDTRWLVVMDDGSAAVFTELARNAGARLILLGSHASSGDASRHGIPGLRHVWAAASPEHSTGSILASLLIANQGSFSIVENFFSAEHSSAPAQTGNATANGSTSGFQTYRLDGPNAIQLHCSGLSPSDGCQALGWNTVGRWTLIPHGMSTGEATASAGNGRNGQPQYADWVESVGYAVMAAALGRGTFQEPCSCRAFVHRSAQSGRPGSAERFTSFVIDI